MINRVHVTTFMVAAMTKTFRVQRGALFMGREVDLG